MQPQEQPRHYESVISHVKIELPEQPMRYTAVPNAVDGKGIWAASGVNEAHVAMTATETITSNPRVLGADPLVVYQKAEGWSAGDMWRDRRGRSCVSCTSVYPQRQRGCQTSGKPAGAVRHL